MQPTQLRSLCKEEKNNASGRLKQGDRSSSKLHIGAIGSIGLDKQQDTFRDDEHLPQFITKRFNTALQQFV